MALKEAIVIKNADTQKVLETRFVPQPDSDRLDREIQNKQLANLLQFYLDRCKRHGLIVPQVTEAVDIQNVIKAVTEGTFEVEFERVGFIYNLQGTSKEPELYKENQIFVVGNETIRELLDIPSDVEAPPVEEVPPPEPLPLEPPAPPSKPTPAPKETKLPKLKEYKDTEEAEIIRVKAAEEEKKKQTATAESTPTATEKRTQEAIHPMEPGVRIPLGKNCDTNKVVYWDPFTPTPVPIWGRGISRVSAEVMEKDGLAIPGVSLVCREVSTES